MLRIMSNNQWRHDDNLPNWAEKGEDCSAEYREKGFAAVYEKLLPDAVGLQEVSPRMLDALMRELQKKGLRYAALWGRDTPIIYRPDCLILLDSEFGIYPREIPDCEGCFNNDDTKSWNIAVFRTKEDTPRTFLLAATHLWWKIDDRAPRFFELYQEGSTAARVYQMGIVIDRIRYYTDLYHCPAILVGDMNCPYGSKPIDFAESAGYVHANHAASEYAYPYHGYHWCGRDGHYPYEPAPWEEAIDHILIKGAFPVKRMDRYIDDSYLALSDHFPAYIDVE